MPRRCRSDTEDNRRKAQNSVLSGAFLLDLPQQNLYQARAILSFLNGVTFLADEPPGEKVKYGHGLVLTLADALLEQAERGIARASNGDTASPESASVTES